MYSFFYTSASMGINKAYKNMSSKKYRSGLMYLTTKTEKLCIFFVKI